MQLLDDDDDDEDEDEDEDSVLTEGKRLPADTELRMSWDRVLRPTLSRTGECSPVPCRIYQQTRISILA